MRRLFDKYDQDGNGVMDTAELGTFIRVGELQLKPFYLMQLIFNLVKRFGFRYIRRRITSCDENTRC